MQWQLTETQYNIHNMNLRRNNIKLHKPMYKFMSAFISAFLAPDLAHLLNLCIGR